MTSVDCVRNQCVLCATHHILIDHEDGGSGVGVHNLPMPEWMIQKVAKDGKNPIPQPDETSEDVFKRLQNTNNKEHI